MNGKMESHGAQQILEKLVSDLSSSLSALRDPAIQSQLQEALHNDKKLPDKNMTPVASEVVDMLHQIDRLLEPAHLVLADHFLGSYIERFHTPMSALFTQLTYPSRLH